MRGEHNKLKSGWVFQALAVLLALFYVSAEIPWSPLAEALEHSHDEAVHAEGEDWACAKHACGCQGPEWCASHCCCSGKASSGGLVREMDVRAGAAVPSPVPLAEGERGWVMCSGPKGDAALSLLRLAPHLAPPPVPAPPELHALLPRLPEAGHPLSRPPRPPFKVPIPLLPA